MGPEIIRPVFLEKGEIWLQNQTTEGRLCKETERISCEGRLRDVSTG